MIWIWMMSLFNAASVLANSLTDWLWECPRRKKIHVRCEPQLSLNIKEDYMKKISSLLFYLIKFRLLKLSIFDLMKIIIFSRLRQLSSWGLFSWRLFLTCDGLNRGSANLSNVDIYQTKPTPKKCNYCHFAGLISKFTLNIHENRIPFEMRWKITEDIEVLRQTDKVADPLLMSGGERKLTDTQSAVETRQPYM